MKMSDRPTLRASRLALGAAAAVALASPGALRAQAGDFEGVITLEMPGANGAGANTAQYMLKAGKVRMESTGRGGLPVVFLFDPATKTMDILVAPQRMYMERRVTDAEVERATTRARPKIEKTGKKETVAGYECEHWNVEDAGERYDVCIAKGLGTFFQGQNPFGGSAAASWYEELKDGAFPLRIDREGGRTLLRVTQIERKPLEPSLFAVPEGYRKMDFPGGFPRRRQ